MSTGRVILVRGISGVGKSTHVEELRRKYERKTRNEGEPPDFAICSADNFFYQRISQSGGCEYFFDPTKLAEAHTVCLANYIDAVVAKTAVIVVDNTFIHHWEMKNYIKLANFHDYDVDIHEIRVNTISELRTCIARNVHKVPADVVSRMALEFEPMDEREKQVKVIPMMGRILR